jgi:hypothetical protein
MKIFVAIFDWFYEGFRVYGRFHWIHDDRLSGNSHTNPLLQPELDSQAATVIVSAPNVPVD